jgi:ketosteroid isomerase-like protein
MSHGKHTAAELLQRMFEVEMRFVGSGPEGTLEDVAVLASAFHPDVVVHEPASLPYSGDWKGFRGVGDLFRTMRQTWSDMRVDGMQAVRDGDTVFMTGTLRLTARANGATISQPFAEVLRFKDELVVEGTPFYYDTSEIVAALR